MEKFKYLSKSKLNNLPKIPGVYAFLKGKQVLYIGKAANLRDRVQNHFHQPSYRDNLFISQITKVGYFETQSEIDALLLESQLIKSRQSKYNVMWKDDKANYETYLKEKRTKGRIENRHPITGIAVAFSGAGLEGGHNQQTGLSWSLKDH